MLMLKQGQAPRLSSSDFPGMVGVLSELEAATTAAEAMQGRFNVVLAQVDHSSLHPLGVLTPLPHEVVLSAGLRSPPPSPH